MAVSSLTNKQIAQYDANGFIVIESVFADTEIQPALTAIAEITARQRPLGKQATKLEWESEPFDGQRIPRRIYNPVDQRPVFKEIGLSDKMLDKIESLLGPNIQLHGCKINIKHAGVGSPVHWHQDLAFSPHTSCDLAACIVYLDPATEFNGCLQVIPGQHQKALMDHTVNGQFRGRVTEDLSRRRDVMDCPAPAGSVVIFHCKTPHRSEANRPSKPRRALILEFRAADAFPIYHHVSVADHEQTATRLVRGQPLRTARFEGTSLPVPCAFDESFSYTSIYDIQQSG